MKRLGLVTLFAIAAVGCSAVKPVPVSVGDVCSRCRRLITAPALAGEMINARMYALKYRTPACMAQYLKEHPQENVAGIFVTDYTTGKMIPVSGAYFVKTEIDAVTHEVDFAAFARHAEAVAFGAPTSTQPVAWDDVKQFASARSGN